MLDTFGGTQVAPWWTKTDTQAGNPHISVSAGNLVIAAPPGAWVNTSLVSKAPYVWARTAGLTIEWQVTPTATNKYALLGFTDGSLNANNFEAHGVYIHGSSIIYITTQTAEIITPLEYSAAQSLWARIVLKATGAEYYVSTDQRATWIRIWDDAAVTVATLYAFIESNNAALTASKMSVYQGTVRTPLTIAAPSLTPSVGAEQVVNGGFDADTDWTKGAGWTIAAGVAAGAATTDFLTASAGDVATMGAWYRMSYDLAGYVGGTIRPYIDESVAGPDTTANGTYTFVARASIGGRAMFRGLVAYTGNIDNASRKLFTLSSLLSANTPAGRQGIWDVSPKVSAGYQSGMLFNYDGATTDAALDTFFAYTDPTRNINVMGKVIAGVWTESIATGSTYTASAQLRCIRVDDGTNMRVAFYKAGVQVGATQTYALADHTTIKDNVGFCALQTVATDANNTPGDLVWNGGLGVA